MHSALIGLTPNIKQDALALYAPQDVDVPLTRLYSAEYINTQAIKAKVVLHYAGDCIRFFQECRNQKVHDIQQKVRELGQFVIDSFKQ